MANHPFLTRILRFPDAKSIVPFQHTAFQAALPVLWYASERSFPAQLAIMRHHPAKTNKPAGNLQTTPPPPTTQFSKLTNATRNSVRSKPWSISLAKPILVLAKRKKKKKKTFDRFNSKKEQKKTRSQTEFSLRSPPTCLCPAKRSTASPPAPALTRGRNLRTPHAQVPL